MGLFVEMKPSKANRIKDYVENLGYGVTFVDQSFVHDKTKIGVYKGTLNLYSMAKEKELKLLKTKDK